MSTLIDASIRLRSSSKWDVAPDVIGVGIAESDYGAPEFIREALADYVRSGSLGYLWEQPQQALVDSFLITYAALCDRRVDRETVRLATDVLSAFDIALKTVGRDGDVVLVPTPAYPPFLDIPERFGKRLVASPMRWDATGHWSVDLDHIEQVVAQHPGGLFVLCNPHNPTGSIATFEELTALSEVLAAHGWHVFSDEIHAPVMHGTSPMRSYASVSPSAREHTITATAASKGWNIAGLKCAQVVIDNPQLRRRWDEHVISGHTGPSTLGVVASTLAYSSEGRAWLHGANAAYRETLEHFHAMLSTHLPLARWQVPEATYLSWVNLGAYLESDLTVAELSDRARVEWLPGASCGIAGAYGEWARINCATDASTLDRLIERLVTSAPRIESL